jgi:N utilization substance protein A
MSVTFGENEVKTVEDLAGLVPDDMRGYYESKDGERVREAGILDEYNLSPEDAEGLIMRARVAAGWIEPEADIEEELGEEDEALGEADQAAEAAIESAAEPGFGGEA